MSKRSKQAELELSFETAATIQQLRDAFSVEHANNAVPPSYIKHHRRSQNDRTNAQKPLSKRTPIRDGAKDGDPAE